MCNMITRMDLNFIIILDPYQIFIFQMIFEMKGRDVSFYKRLSNTCSIRRIRVRESEHDLNDLEI